MTLGQKQRIFTKFAAQLILHVYDMGHELSFGQTLRTKEMAAIYAERRRKRGLRAVSRSLHEDKLAIDLNLFIDGTWQPSTEAHREIGEWWENESVLVDGTQITCCWGGRFNDGNHYSFAHGGRK